MVSYWGGEQVSSSHCLCLCLLLSVRWPRAREDSHLGPPAGQHSTVLHAPVGFYSNPSLVQDGLGHFLGLSDDGYYYIEQNPKHSILPIKTCERHAEVKAY